jgi:hypothetical protein
VDLVQLCEGEHGWPPAPVANRLGLVNVHRFRVTAKASGSSIVQVKGGVATQLRCRAGLCAAGEESVRA